MSQASQLVPTGKYGVIPTSLDLWRLCDALTVIQAALLIVGIDPSNGEYGEYDENWELRPEFLNYRTAKVALEHAIRRFVLDANVIFQGEPANEFEGYKRGTDLINWHRSTVEVSDLRSWLFSKGFTSGFFFPDRRRNADYLDPDHPRFAPKLAAAVHAWHAIEDPGNRSPKAALEKWLREHASEHRLTDADGNVNETGVQECAKVANWEPKGGAPRTPTQINVASSNSKAKGVLAIVSKNDEKPDLDDDDIPF